MERRRFPRQQCRIEAHVTSAEETARVSGEVTDLSLDGCYVETSSPFPMDSLINLSLGLAAASLRAAGKVRYSEKGRGMGIEFMAMNPDDFERLRALTPPHTELAKEMAANPSSSHLPSSSEALEAIIQGLSSKGPLTPGEVSGELDQLKAKKR